MDKQVQTFIPELFVITAKTNLHAGSGSENNGIIDNMIQRDHTTNFPCINAQSLKGALREFFESSLLLEEEKITYIFGSRVKSSKDDVKETESGTDDQKKDHNKDKELKQGEYRFFKADLLSIPEPSSTKMYELASAEILKKQFEDTLKFFDLTAKKDWKYISGEEIIKDDKIFKVLTDDYHLPVIARNCLENGQSQNLWYEQVLPRETRLFFVILRTKDEDTFKKFKDSIIENYVQIGANATIGYGYCKIEHIETSLKIKSEKE